ncbi:hypothetical protein KIN20_001186 [Parelaphostrongylus tenuis]|uniref:Uncharacterized protein n=1 Tax=Parelaphostrongylus tenuis TaxID=148309 RepID=A0AAD5QC27_PARTN|nr:hypothetical protein KIN20_001186 [Parelaphostrongylus tenuis]
MVVVVVVVQVRGDETNEARPDEMATMSWSSESHALWRRDYGMWSEPGRNAESTRSANNTTAASRRRHRRIATSPKPFTSTTVCFRSPAYQK